jgi:glucose/mannose transport system substrate-binding protein
MKKFRVLSILVLIAIMLTACGGASTPAVTSAPATTEAVATEVTMAKGTAYTVVDGDTLPVLAEKNLGSKDMSWAIYGLTNSMHNSDSSYAQITNADVIEVGTKIYIPTKEEAAAFMVGFDVTNPDFAKLRPAPESGQLLVGNYWTSGGEWAGISGVYDLYRAQHPGVDLVHAGTAGGAGVNFNALALTKLQGGDPFDVMQMHVAKEVLLFDPQTYLTPLEDIVNESEGDFLPESLKSSLTVNGHIYSAPLNIHRANVLWVNKKVLADNGLTTPTTFDEFFKVADALQAKGIVPLATGGANGFETRVIFDTVLIGTLGPDKYMDLWSGKLSFNDPKVREAAETFKKMLTYTNKDRDALSWDQAVALVIEGKAAFSIMGDWADGEFKKAGKTEADYEGVPVPGNKGTFDMVSDSFALPLNAPNKENAINFIKLISTKEAQEVFNINKGSICARTDCDYSKFDAYLQSSAADFKTNTVVLSSWASEAVHPSWASAMGDSIIKFAADGDVDAFIKNLVQAAEDAGFPQ